MTMTAKELHEHCARNARACGHAPDCEKVTRPCNWPTIAYRPVCTCGRGEPPRHPDRRVWLRGEGK